MGCYNKPFTVDGHYFETVTEAHRYLQEVDGRIHFEKLDRYLKTGRRILDGHILEVSKPRRPAAGVKQAGG